MGTVVVVPGIWLENTDIDINAWFASKGATVVNRERNRIRWKITLAETLTQNQMDALKALIEGAFNTVTFE